MTKKTGLYRDILLHRYIIFIVYIKTDDIYKDISLLSNVERRFDTLNYESDRPLPKGKIK